MATFAGTHIPINSHSNERINFIVDELLNPKMSTFRSICIYDEEAKLLPDKETWKVTYGSILEGADFKVVKNNAQLDDSAITETNHKLGLFKCGVTDVAGDGHVYDEVHVTYTIDYFPIEILTGFIYQAIDYINTSGVVITDYNISTAPNNWNAVISDLAFAFSMEKLILDFDLWKGRLIFALSTSAMEGEGGDIVPQLESLRDGALDRANRVLENPKFKVSPHLARPTSNYYRAVRGGIGGRGGGYTSSRLRGYRINRTY